MTNPWIFFYTDKQTEEDAVISAPLSLRPVRNMMTHGCTLITIVWDMARCLRAPTGKGLGKVINGR